MADSEGGFESRFESDGGPESVSGLSALMLTAVESVTAEMARAFDVIWSAENGPELMEAFLDSRLAFMVDRSGVTVAELAGPLPGQ